MKTQEVYHFENAELESELAQLAIGGNTLAEEHALDNAGQNLPKKDSPSRPFIGPITAFFNQGIALIRTRLQSALTDTDIERAKGELEDKAREIAKETEAVNNEIRLKKRELEKFEKNGKIAPIRKLRRWRLIRPFTASIGFLDVALSFSAFQMMGYSWILSLFIGLVLGSLIYLLAENYPQVLERCKTRRMKWIVIAITAVFLITVFYTIGYFRSQGVAKDAGIIATPFDFALLNIFCFSVILLIVFVSKPSRLEMQVIDEYKMLLKGIADKESKKRALAAELESAKKAFYEKQEARQKVMLYVCDLEALVVSNYESAVQVYITHNLQRRSDDVMPDMFSETPPPLTLHFTQTKQS